MRLFDFQISGVDVDTWSCFWKEVKAKRIVETLFSRPELFVLLGVTYWRLTNMAIYPYTWAWQLIRPEIYKINKDQKPTVQLHRPFVEMEHTETTKSTTFRSPSSELPNWYHLCCTLSLYPVCLGCTRAMKEMTLISHPNVCQSKGVRKGKKVNDTRAIERSFHKIASIYIRTRSTRKV